MFVANLFPNLFPSAIRVDSSVRAINSISSPWTIVMHFPLRRQLYHLPQPPTHPAPHFEQYRPKKKVCIAAYFMAQESIWWKWPLVRSKYQSPSKETPRRGDWVGEEGSLLVRYLNPHYIASWRIWLGPSRPWSGSQVSHQRLDCRIDHQDSGTEEFFFVSNPQNTDVIWNKITVKVSHCEWCSFYVSNITKVNGVLDWPLSITVFQNVPVLRLLFLVNVPVSGSLQVNWRSQNHCPWEWGKPSKNTLLFGESLKCGWAGWDF